jgi:glycosyltransferase involved in cell wall biosynthesis
MFPYEAFLAEKPGVTTTDAGGPLEVVTDGVTGLVTEARADAVAAAFGRLNATDAAAWGRAGRELAKRVTWDATIERLLAG